MRVAVLHGPGDVRIEAKDPPEPGPGEVRLHMQGALTGGTSAKFVRRGYHARMGDPPVPLGHEGVGVIDALGDGVEAFAVGDRVLPSNSASCGTCACCRRGLTAQCEDMLWLTGFYADTLLVPARVVETNLHPVPDNLDSAVAALAENLACVLKARDRAPTRPGEHAVVIGVGPMGLLWTRVLSVTGVRVTAVDKRADRRDVALSMGAEAVEDVESIAAKAESRTLEADLVVEAAGTPEAWEAALRVVGPGGRVHLFGGPPRGTSVPLDTQRMHYDELLLVSSFHHTPYHLSEALRALSHGLLEPSSLIQEQIELAELPEFFARSPDDLPLKAAVLPT